MISVMRPPKYPAANPQLDTLSRLSSDAISERYEFAKTLDAPAVDKALDAGADALSEFEGQIASRAATQEKLEIESLLALKAPPPGAKKSEILGKHLKKSVKADPVVSAQLLRTWMDENEA